jgi:hypothetical protein
MSQLFTDAMSAAAISPVEPPKANRDRRTPDMAMPAQRPAPHGAIEAPRDDFPAEPLSFVNDLRALPAFPANALNAGALRRGKNG